MRGGKEVDAEVAVALWVRGRGGQDGVAVEVVLLDHGVLVVLGDLLDFGSLWGVSEVSYVSDVSDVSDVNDVSYVSYVSDVSDVSYVSYVSDVSDAEVSDVMMM